MESERKVIVKFKLVYKDGNSLSFRKEIESSFEKIANDTVDRINHNVSTGSKSHLHVEGNVFQLNPNFNTVTFTGLDIIQDSAELYFKFDQDAFPEKDLARMIKMNLRNPNGKTYHKISDGIKAWQPDTIWMHMNSKRYVPKYLCDF